MWPARWWWWCRRGLRGASRESTPFPFLIPSLCYSSPLIFTWFLLFYNLVSSFFSFSSSSLPLTSLFSHHPFLPFSLYFLPLHLVSPLPSSHTISPTSSSHFLSALFLSPSLPHPVPGPSPLLSSQCPGVVRVTCAPLSSLTHLTLLYITHFPPTCFDVKMMLEIDVRLIVCKDTRMFEGYFVVCAKRHSL